MKRLLTELGSALIMLSWAATGQAQTLVGLPQVGVTLTGTLDKPHIVTNQEMLGYVIWFEDAQGKGFYAVASLTRGRRLLKSLSNDLSPNALQTQNSTWGPIVKATLDSVVFADGHFVGPDKGNKFADVSTSLEAERLFAQHVATHPANIWDELNQIAATHGLPPVTATAAERVAFPTRYLLARDLLAIYKHDGETAAFAMAARAATVHTPWR